MGDNIVNDGGYWRCNARRCVVTQLVEMESEFVPYGPSLRGSGDVVATNNHNCSSEMRTTKRTHSEK